MLFLWLLCGVLFLTVIVLLLRNWMMKKNMDDLCRALHEHLADETNTLISTSTRNHHMRRFVADLNKELRILRRQRHVYASGSRKLKEAVTSISHDLRTPLTAICGYLDLLGEEETSETARRYLDIIENRVGALKQLTEELFQYSVTIVSEQNPDREPVDLNKALEACIAEYYAVLKEHRIEPVIQLPKQKIIRYLNPSVLSRILSNLLQNALKYSDGDFTIVLDSAGELTFCNTATGLDHVQVEKLFDRFYTVKDATYSTGLGLDITRTLVEQMDGTITAEYKNHQFCIHITFPVFESMEGKGTLSCMKEC